MAHVELRRAARVRRAPFKALARMFAVARQRRALADLDDHLLRDIGVSPEEARKEAARPMWDAPDHWLR